MAQNRDAPAYQEYAASILAQIAFRTMTLQDRGLFCTMRFECWVNIRLPAKEELLAKILGISLQEVTESLPAVMPFFVKIDGYLICPELEDYRAHLAERKLKQSEGGKLGSEKTNKDRKVKANNENQKDAGTSRVTRRGGTESSDKSKPENQSQDQSTGGAVIDDQFVEDYEKAEKCSALEYSKASKGG